MNLIHKITILIFILSLSACFQPSYTELSETKELEKYSTDSFELLYPKNWEIIKKENLPKELQNKNLQLIIRNPSPKTQFAENLIIITTNLQNQPDSIKYTEESIKQFEKTLMDYRVISKSDFSTFSSQKPVNSILYTFEGKPEIDSGKLKYLFTSITSEKQAVSILATIPINSNSQQNILQQSLTSIRIK